MFKVLLKDSKQQKLDSYLILKGKNAHFKSNHTLLGKNCGISFLVL